MKIIVTGGAGFIGSALVKFIIDNTADHVLVLDKLTYAGNLLNLESISDNNRYQFINCDICDVVAVEKIFLDYKPDAIMHLAAESHVDRSISSSAVFIDTNIIGTYNLLNVSKEYWMQLSKKKLSLGFIIYLLMRFMGIYLIPTNLNPYLSCLSLLKIVHTSQVVLILPQRHLAII